MICDRIFNNFVGCISWQRTYSPRNDSKGIVSETEYILVYSKSPDWQPNRLERTDEMDARYKNPDNDWCNWKSGDASAPGAYTHQGMVYAIQQPITGKLIYPPKNRCWSLEQPEMLRIMNQWCPYELRDMHDEKQRSEICGIQENDIRKGLPYTRDSNCEFLNMGYVLTSSADFEQTITGIIDGLQNSGFSAKDYRAVEIDQTNAAPAYIPLKSHSLMDAPAAETGKMAERKYDPADDVDVAAAKEVLSTNDKDEEEKTVAEILSVASMQNKDFTQKYKDEDNEDISATIPTKIKTLNQIGIKDCFLESASSILLPVFEIRQNRTNKILFNELTDEPVWVKLEKEHLYAGFDISMQDRNIQWDLTASTAVRIDLEKRNEDEFVPKSWLLDAKQMDEFRSYIDSLAPEGKINRLAGKIASALNGIDCIPQPKLIEYIKDVIGKLDSDRLSQLMDNIGLTIESFRVKIHGLLSDYAATQFDKLKDSKEIRAQQKYRLQRVINPSTVDRHRISKSLYTEEGVFNDFEARVIRQVSALPNVEFWHRNLEKGKGFCINGYINHYPDFIVHLKSGLTILIEAKGDDRDNSDSLIKLQLGKAWESESDHRLYRYYMVFENNNNLKGALTLKELVERISRL